MKIKIKIEKRYAYIITSLLFILAGVFAIGAFTDSNGVGHEAGEIGPGTFAGTTTYIFPGDVDVKGDLASNLHVTVGVAGGATGTIDFDGVVQLPTRDSDPSCQVNDIGEIYVNTNGNTKLRLCEGVPSGDKADWRDVN
jgi:hypothetical protein